MTGSETRAKPDGAGVGSGTAADRNNRAAMVPNTAYGLPQTACCLLLTAYSGSGNSIDRIALTIDTMIEPKIAAMQQGIIQAALLAPPSDYVAIKAGFKRLVNLADLFKDTSFSGLAATGKTIRENPQFVKRMVRAIVRGVLHSRDYPEDAIQTMIKHWRMERDVSVDAYNLVKEALIPVPTEKGVELMAHWQSVALNVQPKRPVREYMDLRFVKEVMVELEKK